VPYRLLTEFENLFAGKKYIHRDASRGDFVAMHLYEDLAGLNLSSKLLPRIQANNRILSTKNLRQGIKARRGDGTFGEVVPGTPVISDPGFQVARGVVATVEIGAETKILAKAMIKQIDRVTGDLQKQIPQFKRGAGNPICVALVGINHAPYAVGYEGDRAYRTDGKANRHPIQEAADAAQRLLRDVAPLYDEFIVLHYSATNEEPFPFSWVNFDQTYADYGAALVRISREYDRRF
jgi:hypothetical protein